MSIGLLGNKIGMTQIYDITGNLIPVTIIKVGPCYITELISITTHNYNAIQIGYKNSFASKRINKPEYGNLIKKNLPLLNTFKEVKTVSNAEYKPGTELTLNLFNVGETVTISGISIGKGNAGNIKRHHFKRGPMSHGSKHHRLQGSLGAGTSPGRVFPGKKMSGHLGSTLSTVKNLKIIDINQEDSLIAVKGCIPGKFGNLIFIKK